jgi:hypothetical protein
MSRDDAVVKDVGDIRRSGQESDGGGVGLREGRLNDGYAEVLVALEQMSSG